MSRKLVWACSILAAVMVAAIGWFIYRLFSEERQVSAEILSDSRTEVLCAVPMDAITIYRINSYSDAKNLLEVFAPEYVSVLSSFPNDGNGIGGAISSHPTGKNKLSILMSCVIPESIDGDDFLRGVLRQCAGVVQKRYDASVIHCSSMPELNFVVYGNFFLCSSSLTLLESSLRMLDSGESLLENDIFVEAVRNGFGGESITLNHNSAGKLLSGIARPPYRKYSAFVSHISDWSSFKLDFSREGEVSGTGTSAQRDPKSCYVSVFKGQKGGRSDLTDILPFNAVSHTDLRISDLESFIAGYGNFKYSLGRKEQSDNAKLALARTAGVCEIAGVTMDKLDSRRRLVFVRVGRTDVFCPDGEVIKPCANASLPSFVAGNFFSVPDSSVSAPVSDEWVVLGDRKTVEWYMSIVRNVNFFSLSDWLAQTPVKAAPGRNSILSSMINLSIVKDSLGGFLDGRYAELIRTKMEGHNFNYLTLSVNDEGGGVVPRFTFFSSNLEQMPSPKNSGAAFEEDADSFKVQVPGGPFEVVDFRTGKIHSLEQLTDGKLRLKDEKGKQLWAVPHTGALCGYVSQIDYLKNDKLQMLFASGSKLYLLTRLGGAVKPFPVETGKEILLGPAVFDFNSDKEYIYVVLHTDNTVAFYDRNGKPATGYKPISLGETIVRIPEPVGMGTMVYWIVRTPRQTLIMNAEGVPVANFSKKHRLDPNTEVTVKSSEAVQVSGADGNTYLLDIPSGKFTKR